MLSKVLFHARKHFLKLFGFVLLTFVQITSAWAQPFPGAPIYCDAQFYQTRLNAGNTGTRLLRYPTLSTAPVNFYTGNSTTATVPNLGGTNLNGLGFNPRDGYLYAVAANSTGNTVGIYRLGQSGG